MSLFDAKRHTTVAIDRDGDLIRNILSLYNLSSEVKKLKKTETFDKKLVDDSEEGSLQKIAYKYYGNGDLWRMLAEVNDIVDPINDVKEGVILLMPRYKTLVNLYESTKPTISDNSNSNSNSQSSRGNNVGKDSNSSRAIGGKTVTFPVNKI